MSTNWYQRCKSYQPTAAVGAGPIRRQLLIALAMTMLFAFFFPSLSWAQDTRSISGRVVDAKAVGLPGVTVLVAGTSIGNSTNAEGAFELQVPNSATTLVFSFVGYAPQQVAITGKSTLEVVLQEDVQGLSEVVVVGYGTARKSDLTGAVAVIGEKDFNKGTYSSPDQLIQGRVSGVQITNSSGQPGGAATVKIRGSSAVTGTGQPLYVVDGVPLDGRSARPGLTTDALGGTPDSNPLNFLNPNDIESINVLKDASATAIYGSRAAYGVVIINTKRGKTGAPRIDVGLSTGVSSIMRKMKFLDAGQYRQALAYYGLPTTSDQGASTDALDAILRTGVLQNYNVAMSGGGETGRYRLSLGYLNQDGIVRKTGFKKYSANFSTNLEFLESKKLGVDVNIVASQSREELAAISNNAGFRGSLITQALQWNPTAPLRNPDGSLNITRGGNVINPLAASELYDDNSRVTTALASVSPHYKFTDWLELRALYSVNYSTGIRRTAIGQQLNYSEYQDLGYAAIGNNELLTQQITPTLSFNKQIASDMNLNALLGYEYTMFENSGSNVNAKGPAGGFGAYGLNYTNYIQFSNVAGRNIFSFIDPSYRLQSFFGRAIFNYKERYLLTGTLRADGSSKFGGNNKYGYFPSIAAAWDASQEEFLKDNKALNQLKFRVGYGRTGNQEFPAGSAQARYALNDNGALVQLNSPNPNLKWQSDRQYNAGVDLGFFDNRLTATVDYFYKTTTGLLFPSTPILPSPPPTNGINAVVWRNLPGEIVNKGVEVAIGTTILSNERVTVGFNANATFIRNKVSGLPYSISTGEINGPGLTGVQAEVIQNGLPLNAFFVQQYQGLNEQGLNIFANNGALAYAGDPNPKTLLGLSANARYGKLALVANMTGVFGQLIYNNTLNAVGNIGQIGAGRNIALSTFENPIKEATGNPAAPSTRWLEKGNYLKMSNVTLSYAIGDLGTFLKGANIYATGQNLFVITNYTGFDPEVNTNKTVNNVPSAGIDYAGYPTARTFTLGVNFSL
ncbi:SusC/RagA family TonB-linked outer membrane protein [Hymenobacter sp. BT664]|uniref:SusC/RagA family TonB-linked outer membrane protein n=1 Tax=Hymenobacter montanus TaxID=2771359 RepID=A0A927BBJ1_9BACT|nr:SusC/RagA family TonB-linked outer membrane protein [Hymenobacter montanus]MBD2767265.1 SusC/RagA family TonB-linked outer membrane protein [Hymenobacter montanus]